jgi:hypothetical protein
MFTRITLSSMTKQHFKLVGTWICTTAVCGEPKETESVKANDRWATAYKVTGTFFFAENIISNTCYLDMLELNVVPQIKEVSPRVIFKQDEARPYWSLIVWIFTVRTLPGRCIGGGGPIAWPLRSPDLASMDYFLCEYVKDQEYSTKVNSVQCMKGRTVCAAEGIPLILVSTLSGHCAGTMGSGLKFIKAKHLSEFLSHVVETKIF